MKRHLKRILLLGFGVASLAAIASCNSAANTDVSASSPNASQQSNVATKTSNSQANSAGAPKGNSLAAELQGKPTVVKISADWCSACQRLKPIVSSLERQFKGKANFIVFNVTDRKTTQAAEARAKKLGLSKFLEAHRAQTSTIGIINPSNGQVIKQFKYNFNQQDYVTAINQAIASTKAP